MLIFMQETSNQLLNAIDKYAEDKEPFELKDILGKYSMDTIASCAFGVNAESFTNKNSKFVKFADRMFELTFTDVMKFILVMLPGGIYILRALNLSVTENTSTEFFYEAVMSTLNHGRETKIRRNDLIDLMLDAIKGDLDEDENENEEQEQFEKVQCMKNLQKNSSYNKVVMTLTQKRALDGH